MTASSFHPPVVSDCSHDVARQFNAWLKTVPDGATIDLASGGCYLVNQSSNTPLGTALLALVNKHNITINGHGATIKTTQPITPGNERAELYFELGGGFIVRNLTLKGTNSTADCAVAAPLFSCYDPSVEGDANLRVRGVDGALFDNVHLKHAWGDGLELAPGRLSAELERTMSRNITIQNSTVDTVGRHAFTCTGCRNFTVKHNIAKNIGYHVVDVELQTASAKGDLKLVDNTFSNYYLSIVNAAGKSGLKWGSFVLRRNAVLGQSATCVPSYWLVPESRNLGAVTIADNRVDSNVSFARIGTAPSPQFPQGTGSTQLNITGNTGRVWHASCGVDNSGLPGGSFPAVLLWNTPSGSITSNTFLDADPVAKQASSMVTVCGNRTTPAGAFDQPAPC